LQKTKKLTKFVLIYIDTIQTECGFYTIIILAYIIAKHFSKIMKKYENLKKKISLIFENLSNKNERKKFLRAFSTLNCKSVVERTPTHIYTTL